MLRSYSERALIGVGILALFWLALRGLTAGHVAPTRVQSVERRDDGRAQLHVATPETRLAPALSPTLLTELPALPQHEGAPNKWDLIEGLNATPAGVTGAVTGQTALAITALGSEGRHAIAVRFAGLTPGALYSVTVWVRAHSAQRVMIEARDSVVATTHKASHYGVAQYDVASGSVMRALGDLQAHGVGKPKEGWLPLWCSIHTKDGQIYVLLGFLEGLRNLHMFKGEGQELVLGGFEITRQ